METIPDLTEFIKNLSVNDKKTLSQQALKVSEECGELAKAVLPYDSAHGTVHKFPSKAKILDQIADVILAAASIAYKLGYEDEDIKNELSIKSIKWAGLQAKQDKLKYPVPYEIHVTVAMKAVNTAGIGIFKEACGLIGVKPIVLDLGIESTKPLIDVMTSSHFLGDNIGAYHEMTRIADALRHYGFRVVREKIETIPFHPAAPSDLDINPTMPEHCYFESHISVYINPSCTKELLLGVIKEHDAHLSRNFFKQINADVYINMVTLRSYTGTYEQFKIKLDKLIDTIRQNRFEYDEKIITEFSIYDTKISHDYQWLKVESAV